MSRYRPRLSFFLRPFKENEKNPFATSVVLAKLLAEAYKASPRWFEDLSNDTIAEFAYRYATKLWKGSPTGNTFSMVASLPRYDGQVLMFDLDAGEFWWTQVGKLVARNATGRAQQWHFECDSIMGHDLRCETEEIEQHIDWASLKAFDKTRECKDLVTYGRDKAQVARWARLPKGARKLAEG